MPVPGPEGPDDKMGDAGRDDRSSRPAPAPDRRANADQRQEAGRDAHLIDAAPDLCVDGRTEAERSRLRLARDPVRALDRERIAVAADVPGLRRVEHDG